MPKARNCLLSRRTHYYTYTVSLLLKPVMIYAS